MKTELVRITPYDADLYRKDRDVAQKRFAFVTIRKGKLGKAFREKAELLDGRISWAKASQNEAQIKASQADFGKFVSRTAKITSSLAARVKAEKDTIHDITEKMIAGTHKIEVVLVLDPWAKRMRLVHPVTYELLAARFLEGEEFARLNDRQRCLPGMNDEAPLEPLWDQEVEEPDMLTRDLIAGMPDRTAVDRFNAVAHYGHGVTIPMGRESMAVVEDALAKASTKDKRTKKGSAA